MSHQSINIPAFLQGHPDLVARYENEVREKLRLNQCGNCDSTSLLAKYFQLVEARKKKT